MPVNIPIPFGMQSYQSRSRPFSAQRLVNWYAEMAPQGTKTKSPLVLLPRQGLASFCDAGNGPIRGAIEFLGVFYIVSGNTLYSVDAGGTETSLGTISGVGYVQMATNTTQISIVSRPNAWVYTPSTTTLTQITDPDFPGSAGVTQLTGYFVHMVPDDSGEFFTSNLDDGLNFDALNFATAESDSDPMIRPFSDHGELFLFGSRTVEVWANNGGGGFPFSRTPTAALEKGCIAALSIAKCDNTIFWVGSDKIVYRMNGYTPMRVSTHAIEAKIADTPTPSDIIAMSYVADGHTFYVMTSQSGEWSLAFDTSTGLWANRATYPDDYWHPTTYAEFYGKSLVGDSSLGLVYEMETGLYTDNDQTIRFEATTPPIFEGGARLTMSKLYVDMETGVGLTTGQGSNPQAMLQWSDDGGRTWSNEHWRSIGQIGEYRHRVEWRRLGQFRERIFKLAVTDAIKPVILGAYADVELGAA